MFQPRRRRRASFGGGQPGRQPDHYESLDDDTVDDDLVEEPEEPVERQAPVASARVMSILNRARERANAAPQADSPVGAEEEVSDELLQARLEQVRQRASGYEREYRLRTVHRLLMRKLPLDEIASSLNVSVSTVQRDRREIFRRMRQEASRLDINALLGETIAYYNEAGAMAFRIATMGKTAIPHRLAAIRTAMQSRKEIGQWLAAAGVFEQLKFVPDTEAGKGDLSRLIELTDQILKDEDLSIEGLTLKEGEDEGLEDDNIELML